MSYSTSAGIRGLKGELFLVLALFCSHSAFALQKVTLAWNPSPDTNVTGYYIYYGVASGHYTGRVSVAKTNAGAITGLLEATTYFFSLTAHNAAGVESAPAGEISYLVPGFVLSMKTLAHPGFPRSFALSAIGTLPLSWAVEASTDLKTWRTIGWGTNALLNMPLVVSPKPSMFFRLKSPMSGVSLKLVRSPTNGFPNSFCVVSSAALIPSWTLETSQDLKTWNTFATGVSCGVNVPVIVSDSPAMFFRLKAN
jgi:hypothetical protein